MPYDTTTTTTADERLADLRRVERMARLLDTRYTLPGTRIRFGLDSVIGLIPGVGDTVMLLPSFWMLAVAWKHGVPASTLARMGANAGVDYVVGSVPILGDAFDLFFKSHRRNAQLLSEALAPPKPALP
jgi:hypothetical protein